MKCANLVLSLWVAAVGCDSKTADEKAAPSEAKAATPEAKDAPAQSEADGPPGADHKPGDDTPDDKEDKGSASIKLDGTLWTATRAKASVREDRLRISASNTVRDGPKMDRQQLTLTLHDYKGEGEYTTKRIDSHFTGVGLDTDKVKKAEGDDAKTSKVAVDAIKGGKVTLMPNAKVTITKAGDDFIDGTVTWSPNGGAQGPTMTEGQFHARVRKKRK